MNVRKAAVAGQFYGGTRAECLSEIGECMPKTVQTELPSPIAAAIVPHAGWVFSGNLAATAFWAIRQANGQVDTFVLFGAAHRYYGDEPAVFDSGVWETPLGRIEIDEELARLIVGQGGQANPSAHKGEHSIEVQIPFIQYLFPNAKIVPVVVPTGDFDPEFGTRVGKIIKNQTKKIVCAASTDLTHYGPRYGFCPEGSGAEGLRWAHEVNDKAFIDLALQMEPQKLFEQAMEYGSACGPAATAAAVAAAKALGRSKGILLGHTNSRAIMLEKFQEESEESVGYAAIIF